MTIINSSNKSEDSTIHHHTSIPLTDPSSTIYGAQLIEERVGTAYAHTQLGNTIHADNSKTLEEGEILQMEHQASEVLLSFASDAKVMDDPRVTSEFFPIAPHEVNRELINTNKVEYQVYLTRLLHSISEYIGKNKNNIEFQNSLSNHGGVLSFPFHHEIVQLIFNSAHREITLKNLPSELVEEGIKYVLHNILHVTTKPNDSNDELINTITQTLRFPEEPKCDTPLPLYLCSEVAQLHAETIEILASNTDTIIAPSPFSEPKKLNCYLLTPQGDSLGVTRILLTLSLYGTIQSVHYCDKIEKAGNPLNNIIKSFAPSLDFPYGMIDSEQIKILLNHFENSIPTFALRMIHTENSSKPMEVKIQGLERVLSQTCIERLQQHIGVDQFNRLRKTTLPTVIDRGITKLAEVSRSNITFEKVGIRGSFYLVECPKKALVDLSREIYLKIQDTSLPIIYLNTKEMVDDNWWDIEEYISEQTIKNIFDTVSTIFKTKPELFNQKKINHLHLLYRQAKEVHRIHLEQEQNILQNIVRTLNELLEASAELQKKAREFYLSGNGRVKIDNSYFNIKRRYHGKALKLTLTQFEIQNFITTNTALEELEQLVIHFSETSHFREYEDLSLLKSESIPWIKKVINRRKKAQELKEHIKKSSSKNGFHLFMKKDEVEKFIKAPEKKSYEIFNPYSDIVIFEDHLENPRPGTLVIGSYDEISNAEQAFYDSKFSLVVANGLDSGERLSDVARQLFQKRKKRTYEHVIISTSFPVKNLSLLQQLLFVASPILSRKAVENGEVCLIKDRVQALINSKRAVALSIEKCFEKVELPLMVYIKFKELFFHIQKLKHYSRSLTLSSCVTESNYYDPYFNFQGALTKQTTKKQFIAIFEKELEENFAELFEKFQEQIPKSFLLSLYQKLKCFAENESDILLSMTQAMVHERPTKISHPHVKLPKKTIKLLHPNSFSLQNAPMKRKITEPALNENDKRVQLGRPKRQKTIHKVESYDYIYDINFKTNIPRPQFTLIKQSSSASRVFHRKRWQGDLRGSKQIVIIPN